MPAEDTAVLSDDGEGAGPSTRLRRTPRPLVDTGASSVSVETTQLASGLRLWGSEELPVMKADFCLYVELVEEQASMENMEHTHALMTATADMLRKIGCEVSLHALVSPESEQLARSLLDTRVYVLMVGSTALCTRIRLNQRSKTEDSDATLPSWLLHHQIYIHHVKPLAGQAQSQQLTKLILKEYRFAATAPSPKRDQDEQPELHHGRELLISGAAGTTMLSQLTRCEHLQTQLFPLHRDDFREQMITKWREHSTYSPPLLEIYQYFGPTIAMYFSWLDFYTSFLVLPAVIGVALHILGLFNAQSYCLHSFVLAIGTSVFVDFWKRKQREVEYTWKYHHHQEEDQDSQHQTPLATKRLDIENLETRPSFRGEWMKDPVTQQTIYDYPHHKRFFRQLLAIPLLLFMCSIVGAYVVALNLLSDKLRLQYHTCFLKHGDDVASPGHEKDPLHLFTSSPLFCMLVAHGPGVLNAVSIHIMDQLYQNLARRLNEYENYRTAEEFDDHLVMKRMPFHFVNSNASLWLLAFYVQDIQRVRDRLWILMVAMQVLDNCKEVALPLVISLAGEWFTPDGRRRRSSSGSGSVGRARRGSLSLLRRFSLSSPTAKPEDNELSPEEQVSDRLERVLLQKRQAQYKDTFADYKEMMIQYGYVALYSPIFPLAPVFAWLNNVIESRSDFFKLVSTHSYQRPIVHHARRGIGAWEHVLVGFSVAAVIVNCALVWTYELDDLLPTWSDLHRFMFIVVRSLAIVSICSGPH